MKYLKQLSIILSTSCAGELLKHFLPLPVPASIYGLVLMLVLLITKAVKIEQVDVIGTVLVEIMPVMFIPAGVGLMTALGTLEHMMIPVLVITIGVTFLVMAVTGKMTDLVITLQEAGSKKTRKDILKEAGIKSDIRKESRANARGGAGKCMI